MNDAAQIAFWGNRVNSVEHAIRAALAKGDINNSEFRRRIFGSASAALERSLAARTLSETETAARRQSLVNTINHIESECITAPDPEVPQVELQDQTTSATLPRFEVASHEQLNTHASIDANRMNDRERIKPGRAKPTMLHKNRSWFKFALNGGFLFLLILGGFWAYAEGKRIYFNATSPMPNSQKPTLAENSAAGTSDSIKWVSIFSASDTDLVSSAVGAKAEITSRDSINYVVMSGDSTNEVSVKIGSGLVQTFAGKRVLFNIKARSVTGAELDTGAHCDFGVETKCDCPDYGSWMQ